MGILLWKGIHPVVWLLLPMLAYIWYLGVISIHRWLQRLRLFERHRILGTTLFILLLTFILSVSLFPSLRPMVEVNKKLYIAMLMLVLWIIHPAVIGMGIYRLITMISSRKSTSSEKMTTVDYGRRRFLALGLMAAPPVTTSLFLVTPSLRESSLAERFYSLKLPSLSNRKKPLRISVFSDLHIDFFFPFSILSKVIHSLRKFSPDIILFAGDLVSYDVNAIERTAGFWRVVTNIAPVYSILGNHDAWSGSEEVSMQQKDLGIRLLRDETVALNSFAKNLYLCGARDIQEEPPPHFSSIETIPEDGECILLAHNPDTLYKLKPFHRVSLLVSGHTHGGQVRLPGIGPLVNQADRALQPGLTLIGKRNILVTSGLGFVTFPVRINCPSEIVHLTLGGRV